jgi:hypothetical protein
MLEVFESRFSGRSFDDIGREDLTTGLFCSTSLLERIPTLVKKPSVALAKSSAKGASADASYFDKETAFLVSEYIASRAEHGRSKHRIGDQAVHDMGQ